MLPPIPARLSRIDEVTVAKHFSLDGADRCLYVWEYAARRGYAAGPTNQFIKNLKIKPSELTDSAERRIFKRRAIEHAAQALRLLLGRDAAEGQYTFVPMPCSKSAGDPDYDDRMHEVLARAFSGWSADVRPVLRLRCSTPADHEQRDRMRYDELLRFTELERPCTALRPTVVIVDDVLNSGKHFKVAQCLLTQASPAATVIGLFLARCIRGRDGP